MSVGDALRRRRNRRKATGALAELYETDAAPDRWLSVDVETTGLDPAKDRLLSIGWVPVDGDEIILGGAGHVVLRDNGDTTVGESATIHGITDDALASGVDPEEAVAQVLAALTGRRLLAHYAKMELGFLDKACRQYFGAGFDVPTDDTMDREYRMMSEKNLQPSREGLRLWTLLEKYGLPTSKAHHALNDAIAAAEVWLAQTAHGLPK